MKIKAVVFDAYGTLYDVQSVAEITEDAFPGYGGIVTQIWRIKQLEYSWLRSLMQRYADFAAVTRDSLVYTLRCLGLQYDRETFDAIIEKYRHLDLYHDARIALDALERTQACDPLQWQSGDAERAGQEQRTRRRARCDLKRRSHESLQAQSGRLRADRSAPRRQAGRGAVRVVEPVGCLRRQILWPQRRLDRTRDARRRWRWLASRAISWHR